jgi:hypothetical protein
MGHSQRRIYFKKSPLVVSGLYFLLQNLSFADPINDDVAIRRRFDRQSWLVYLLPEYLPLKLFTRSNPS